MSELHPLAIDHTATIRAVMARIDSGEKGVALLVDSSNRFVNMVTDGDIRRAILSGRDLDSPAIETKPADCLPVTARWGTPRAKQIEMMRAASVRHLPLLDEFGVIIDVATNDELMSDTIPVQAVIMAGGFGTRLRPWTDSMPKPMLPIGGKPLMERTIECLQQAGVRRINVTTHYLPDKITGYFGNGSQLGVELKYVPEEAPLGTAGALQLMDQVDDLLLVMNGDILTNVDFRSMVSFHHDHGAELTVAVRQYDIQVPYGVVDAKDGLARQLREKPTYDFLVNAGIYLLEPSVREFIPHGQRYDMTDLISALLAEQRKVACFPIREYWLDIGHPDDFEKAQHDVVQDRWAA